MTYKDLLHELRNESSKKYADLLKADTALEIESEAVFMDKARIDNYTKANREWQDAHNEFLGLFLFLTKNKIDLNTVIPQK